MREMQLDLSVANEKKAFISGFCLGARIVIEVTSSAKFDSDDEKNSN